MMEPTLAVNGLTTQISTSRGLLRAVDDVSYEVRPGETLGVVGESGSGKSMTVLSLLGLLPRGAKVTAGQAFLQGRDLLKMSKKELRLVRGQQASMVFQDPMTSLNPVLTVGYQLAEALRAHGRVRQRSQVRDRVVELLEQVGIPDPKDRVDAFPHEFSGGMRQRVVIAMAMANRPDLIIADEPTTALDVTIQAQVLDLLKEARSTTGAATILITHDLGLLAEMADRVVVMYAGRVVEAAEVDTIFTAPRHPYTIGLMASRPRVTSAQRMVPISGQPPDPLDLPEGCAFHPRCSLEQGRSLCRQQVPALLRAGAAHVSACHFHEELSPARSGSTSPSDGGP